VKAVGEFHRRGKGRQRWCKECAAATHQSYFRSNARRRQATLRRSVVARAEDRAFLIDHLRTHPCVDCGESDIEVLEFDHVRGEKRCEVSTLLGSPRRLREEIAKCDVRCGNCHRRKTARENDWWIYRAVQRLREQRGGS
jgi:hypothetical protein